MKTPIETSHMNLSFTGRNRLLLVCSLCLLCLLTACGQTSSPQSSPKVGAVVTPRSSEQANSTPVQNKSMPTPVLNSSTPVTSSSPAPSTVTDCPATGMARAMVMTPMARGTHPTIVYALNEGPFANPTRAILRRYDVTTGVKTDILSLPSVSFSHAQLSPNGQWLLFAATDKLGSMKLQAVRLDGQELQTLYCTTEPGLGSLQWSPTQRLIAFTSGGPGNAEQSVYLLDIVTGALQAATSFAGSESPLVVRTWPDNTRIYLTDTPANGHFSKLYLLDTKNGANQPLNSLTTVAQGTFNDFDSTPNASQLFLNSGGCSGGSCPTPSIITAMPITGGAAHSILSSTSFSVVQVRSIDDGKLLLIVNSSNSGKNGLWIMDADGTHMLHLNADDASHWSTLNEFGQYTWSNVSHDGSMYALLSGQPAGGNTAYTLLYGSLSGGQTTVFASAPDGNNMLPSIVGWTTL